MGIMSAYLVCATAKALMIMISMDSPNSNEGFDVMQTSPACNWV